MGYTHYFKSTKDIDIDTWQKVKDEAMKIIAMAAQDGIMICGPHGTEDPLVDEESIDLNGDESKGEACESFNLNRAGNHDFCKTNRGPYDDVVVAILASCKHHAPWLSVGSDGGESDWREGLDLYSRATGRKTTRGEVCS